MAAHHHPHIHTAATHHSPVEKSPIHAKATFPLHDVEIYPPIGIARVGNSRLESLDHGWFYGPEIPGHFEEPKGGFKDEHGAVKRQVKFFLSPATFNDLIFNLVRPLDSEFMELTRTVKLLKSIKRAVMSSFGKFKSRTRKPLGTLSWVDRNFSS